MKSRLLAWGREAIHQKKGWLFLLAPFSFLFGLIVLIRNFLYDKEWLPVARFPDVTVISVGNIAAGGTGKTPFLIELLEKLQPLPVAVLTRGYGAKKGEFPLVVTALSDPAIVGDEPLLIAKRAPHAKVIVDPDRVRGAEFARREGYKVLLLDDGMQHRRLGRDIDIVVLDDSKRLLPWGLLREPLSSLKRASYLVSYGELQLDATIPAIKMKKVIEGSDLRAAKVGLFTGVGRPSQVLSTVEEAGASVVKSWFLADHEAPSINKLRDFASVCENLGASFLVCTEKDAVKLAPNLSLPLPIYPLRMRLEVVEGCEYFETLLSRIVNT